MGDKSKIEWTDATWNPVTGCTKISPGCKHCYAEVFAERWRGIPGHPYEQGFDLKLHPDRLEQPLRWKKPRTIFVNSMSDLFHEDIPVEFLWDIFAVMALSHSHTFQVLTKRPFRMLAFCDGEIHSAMINCSAQRIYDKRTSEDPPRWLAVRLPLPNVWLGTSVENQDYVRRIDSLRETPAAIRFLSLEPLLGPLHMDLEGIDWVIVGGESGAGARPMNAEWVRDIRDQCLTAGVPFFFKQWGGVQKKKAGRILDGRTWDEMPDKAIRK